MTKSLKFDAPPADKPPMPLELWIGVPGIGCVDTKLFRELTSHWSLECTGMYSYVLRAWAIYGKQLPADTRSIAKMIGRDDALECLLRTQKHVFELFEKRGEMLWPKCPPVILVGDF